MLTKMYTHFLNYCSNHRSFSCRDYIV